MDQGVEWKKRNFTKMQHSKIKNIQKKIVKCTHTYANQENWWWLNKSNPPTALLSFYFFLFILLLLLFLLLPLLLVLLLHLLPLLSFSPPSQLRTAYLKQIGLLVMISETVKSWSSTWLLTPSSSSKKYKCLEWMWIS